MAVGHNYLCLRPFWRTDLPEKCLPLRTSFRGLLLTIWREIFGDWKGSAHVLTEV